MPKIAFMGAGSTVFMKNIPGDCMGREALKDSRFALCDALIEAHGGMLPKYR